MDDLGPKVNLRGLLRLDDVSYCLFVPHALMDSFVLILSD
jgi:hypothetical protein